MNRLDSISDSTGTSVACTYLGAGQIVKETDAGATLSYLNADGTNVTGLDRFGRVVDQIWRNPANDIIDEYMYGYDREGNRTYRKNVVAGASQNLDEAYRYDAWNRLVEVDNVSDSSLVATYRYDAKNERVTKTLANGAKTEYYYNQQWQVLEERTTPTSGPTSIECILPTCRRNGPGVLRTVGPLGRQ